MTVTSRHTSSARSLHIAPWLNHYPEFVPNTLTYPQVPAWALLDGTSRSHGDRVACHYYKQQFTYAELAQAARQLADVLVQRGIKPGDRVGVLLPNTPESLIALNGIWMAGGVVVSISPLMVAEEVSAMLRNTDCKTVIALDLLTPALTEGDYLPETILLTSLKDRLPWFQKAVYSLGCLKRLGLRRPSDGIERGCFFEEIAAGDPHFQPVEATSIEDPAFILPTGGTTAAPKAVVLSHRNLVSNAWQLHHWGGATMGEETVLAVVPFFHSYGLTTCAMTGSAMAATLVLQHRFVPRRVLHAIKQYQPTVFHAVPAMLAALNKLMRKRPGNYRSINFCMSGGAPLPQSIGEEFARHTEAVVVEGYGLSEASPVTHAGPLDGGGRSGTIGLPLPDTDVRIVDPEQGTRLVPPGEVGELAVRGPQVMLGYWNNPQATASAIRDGWLYTGDLATYDEDGFFRIVDRKKDLIITSGFNVYPSDVESVIRRFPGVSDAAVVGIPDLERGEIVKVILVLDKNTQLDRKVFESYCEEHLSKHKRPRIVDVVDGDLPRNFLGKVLRKDLRTQEVRAAEPTVQERVG